MADLTKQYLYKIPTNTNHAATKVFGLIENGQTVFEIGCASGVQTRHLKETLECHVTGLEINALAAESARPYCKRLIVGDIEKIDLVDVLGETRFDVITFIDVLEHLYDPADALKKLRPFLAPNGHLIASIPNIAHAAICWELAHGRFNYQKYGLLDDTHIRFFTKKNVARLFTEAGYEIVVWDRVIKTPEETEFEIRCGSDLDQSFLDWVGEHNSEANTYQFIVKARACEHQADDSSYQLQDAHDTICRLEDKISGLSRQNRALKSQISWLENHRFGPLTSLLSRLLKKSPKSV